MATNRSIQTIITTEKTPEEIREAVRRAFYSVSGQIIDTKDAIIIEQGTLGVSCAFSINMMAFIHLWRIKENTYRLECYLQWKWNALSWICFVVGWFVLGILWVVPLCTLFFNPLPTYQRALYEVQHYL